LADNIEEREALKKRTERTKLKEESMGEKRWAAECEVVKNFFNGKDRFDGRSYGLLLGSRRLIILRARTGFV